MTGIKPLLGHWATIMQENKARLIELDGVVGDSDLGLTMADGFAAAYAAIRDSEEADAGLLAYAAGKAMGAAVPSTMGTLMSSGLISAGKALRGVEVMESPQWLVFFTSFFQGVQNRGKAQLGEKTFLDGLYPGVEALKEKAGDTPAAAASAAAQASHQAFLATKGMVAKHGRMAIHGEQSRQYVDPGAAVAALLMDGFSQMMNNEG